MRLHFAAPIAIGLFFSGRSSHAQDPNARASANERVGEARSALERHDYAGAAAAFERAAMLAPHPATWLNAASAWEDAGDWVGVATDCDRALALREIAPEYTEEADARLMRSKVHVATLDVRGDPAFTVTVDGGEARSLPRLFRLPPGSHDVTVMKNGRPLRQIMTLEAGETKIISVEATSGLPGPPPESHAPAPGAISVLAFGAGSVLLAGGLVFGGLTLADKSSFDDSPSRDSLDRFKRDRAVCDILIGTSVIAGALGLYLWVTQPATKTAPDGGLRLFARDVRGR